MESGCSRSTRSGREVSVQEWRPMVGSVMTRRKWMISFGIVLLLVVSFFAYFAHNLESSIPAPVLSIFRGESRTTNAPMRQRSICKLVELNPWDISINKFLQPVSGPKWQCNLSADHYTELRNGRIRVIKGLDKNETCKYRCILPNGEENYNATSWKALERNISEPCECDLVETRCENSSSTLFAYVHMQARVTKGRKYRHENRRNPSVLVFIVDSTSLSNGARSLSKTRHVLHKYFESTTFYYHNKNGYNSRPNAHAIFSGNRIEPLHIGTKRQLNITMEEEVKNSCRKAVEDDHLIMFDFAKRSYAIALADDWVNGFYWPDCKGYSHLPTEHYMRPLSKLHEQNKKFYAKHFVDGVCITIVHKTLEYMSVFLKSHLGIAKFMHIWTSLLSHDQLYGVNSADDIIADFFRQNIHTLNNSFIFFMGDHGFRFGEFRGTPVGAMEDNNPMLEVALPSWLRRHKELIINIRDNSHLHTSHYDLYATFVDIAKVARKDNFMTFRDHDFREELGPIRGRRAKSLFRPIKTNRTCEEMDIAEEYCLCVEKWITVNQTSNFSRSAGQYIADAINSILKEKKLDHLCEKLQLKEVLKEEKHESQTVVRMKISTVPSGIFEAQLRYDDGQYHIASDIYRIDGYGKRADCASWSEDRRYCHCKGGQT